MVSISTPVFDLSGNVILAESASSDLRSAKRRVTRTATLDGGVSIPDMGFSHGDRTLVIRVKNISKSKADQVSYLQRNYPLLIVSTDEGVFIGAISSKTVRKGELTITCLIKEKLTED